MEDCNMNIDVLSIKKQILNKVYRNAVFWVQENIDSNAISKIGVVEFLKNEEEWPLFNNQPMLAFAQIDLSMTDLSKISFTKDLDFVKDISLINDLSILIRSTGNFVRYENVE